MRIDFNFSRFYFTNDVPSEETPVEQPQTLRQDSTEAGDKSIINDMLFDERGIGQSSSFGKRYLTPEQIQNITPEELAEIERRKKMADAGARAAAEGANTVSNLLPTNPGSAISGTATTVMSEAVDHVVEKNTTAPENDTTAETKSADTNNSSTTPATEGQDSSQTSETKTVQQPEDPGFRLNPEYIGISRIGVPGPKPELKPLPQGQTYLHANLRLDQDLEGDQQVLEELVDILRTQSNR